jgi:flagellar hook assembly protein FlgD
LPAPSQLIRKPIEKLRAANFPNPFNPSTTITFSLEYDSHVTVDVYNIQGRKIRTLYNRFETSGSHSVLWDGNNSVGAPVSSGIYYFKIDAVDQNDKRNTVMKRMILLK